MKTIILPLCLAFSACASGSLSINPNPRGFGEVDFNESLPPEGYAAQEVYLQNDGNQPLTITLYNVDEKRVLVSGQFEGGSGYALPTLEPGQYHTLTIGVIGYDVESGERDTLVQQAITVDAPSLKEPSALIYSYTPIRVFDNEDD